MKQLSIEIRVLLLESTTILVILATLSMKEEQGEKRKKKAVKTGPRETHMEGFFRFSHFPFTEVAGS